MNDAVIVSTARTPIGKAYRGAFNNTHGATMGAHVRDHAVRRAGIDWLGFCISSREVLPFSKRPPSPEEYFLHSGDFEAANSGSASERRPEPQGGRSTVVTTAEDVRGRKSEVVLGAGKVVRSTTRKRSRVMFEPVLLVKVRRKS